MRHEFSLLPATTRGEQARPGVINSDICSLIVADSVWLHSTPPLLGLRSISTPQVSNFDSLTTLISILESSVADIQFLCGENKGRGVVVLQDSAASKLLWYDGAEDGGR